MGFTLVLCLQFGRLSTRGGRLPATLLGQLAIDKSFQGRGHAKDLLLFALKTSLRVSKSIGSVGVVAHPLDDRLRRFYGRWGFRDLPFDPHRAMMARMTEVERYFGK
jgi:GNAT superfamily N-acetyltransferase